MSILALRPPRPEDAAAIWRLAPQRGSERDSCYGYLLRCTHFADSGLVAEQDAELIGFALGYRPPLSPDQLFVSHLGVASRVVGSGLRRRLLDELLARPACADARFLCMTSAPDDAALKEILIAVARGRRARYIESPCFSRTLFAEPHPDEHLLRVGPLHA